MIEVLIAVWLGTHVASTSPPSTFDEIASRLPQTDGVSGSEQLGLGEAYHKAWQATADLWLHPEIIDQNESSWAFYSAQPAFGRPSTRAVAFSWKYVETDFGRSRYVVARRVSYTNADVKAAVAATFPIELMTEDFHLHARGGNLHGWPEDRANWMPDAATVARLVSVERSIIDEPSCPSLTAALRRLNGLDVPPVRLQGYGPGDGPPVAPETIKVVGDGTSFRLDVKVSSTAGDLTWVTLTGNHGSIPGDWIEAFEAETAGCWRPDEVLAHSGDFNTEGLRAARSQ